ncbi:MAG: hypothetical protein ACRC2T_17015 [Thermoguttaceae bacterium]
MTYILEDLRQLACRAHYGTSQLPDERAEYVIREYSAELEADLETVRENGGDEERYVSNYRKYFTAWLYAKSNCISTLVAGRSNFNSRRAEKANKTEDKRCKEFREWRQRAIKAIERDARKAAKSEVSEVETMQQKIKIAELAQARMKSVNAIIRKHKANPDAAISVLMEKLQVTEPEAQKWVKPDYAGCIGFASYQLTNNNADIRRMKARLVELEKKEATSGQEAVNIDFPGGTIELNFQDDRVRILYPGKPDATTIANLKKTGFRWSPTNFAWQRQLTHAAIHSVIQLTDCDATKLFELYHQSGR